MGMGSGWGPGMGMQGGMRGGMHGPETAADISIRLAALKADLKITAAQDSTWEKYTAFVEKQAESHEALHAQMQAQFNSSGVSPADRTAQRDTMLKLRDQYLAQRDTALKDLQAVLTPEQKLLADQRLSFMYGGPRMAWRGSVR